MLGPLFLALLLFQQPAPKPQQPPPDSQKKSEKPADQSPLKPVPAAPEDPTAAPTDADAPSKASGEKAEKPEQKAAPKPGTTPAAPPAKAQKPAEDITKPPADITAPPLEMEDSTPKVEYTLNPEKARKELEVGKYHMRRSNWAAAAARFEEATKWNPGYADAWLSLAEARERKGELAKSLEAYRKFLDLDPDAKRRKEAEKAMARVQRELKQ